MRRLRHMKSQISNSLLPDILKFSEQFAFGHREIIVCTLELPSQTIFCGGIQHGWVDYFNTNHNLISKSILSKPKFFSWNMLRKSSSERKFESQSYIPIGSPWGHLVEYIESRGTKKVVQESEPILLYFPKKSHYGWEPKLELQRILKFKDDFRIRVCLYWLDAIDYRLTSWLQSNEIDFFCAGYRGSSTYDFPWMDHGGRSTFLISLYKEIRQSKIVVVDDVGSAFWYALSLGKPVQVLEKSSESKVCGSHLSPGEVYKFNQDNEQYLKLVDIDYSFTGEFLNVEGELIEKAKIELGWNHLNSAKSLILEDKSNTYIEHTLPTDLTENVKLMLNKI
jgi:hypothetical protein